MDNQKNAIEVRDVKKYFKVFLDRGITFKDKILSKGRNRYEKREVLKGISFSVKKGEAIGLIGKNGCGKSTTLKLLTKIIYPNEGSVEMQGRVSSLLELGAGFHPDMSGKENIYMNAAVFGLTRKEIDKRVKDIIKFSELEEYIDNPVRTYSSGMYMRLAFSVAINVDADILLIDEILAVGDVSFQKKCFEKLKEIKMSGTTIVIVSHSLDQIEKICDRTIWLKDGLIHEEGKPKEIHERYLYDMEKVRLEKYQRDVYEGIHIQAKASNPENADEHTPNLMENTDESTSNLIENVDENTSNSIRETKENEAVSLKASEQIREIKEKGTTGSKNGFKQDTNNLSKIMNSFNNNFLSTKEITRQGTGNAFFSEMFIADSQNNERIIFETGEDVKIYLHYTSQKKDLTGTICLLIYRDDGLYCYGTNTFIEMQEIVSLKENGYVEVLLFQLPLLPGKYYFTIAMYDERVVYFDLIQNVATMQVLSKKGEQGVVRVVTTWSME